MSADSDDAAAALVLAGLDSGRPVGRAGAAATDQTGPNSARERVGVRELAAWRRSRQPEADRAGVMLGGRGYILRVYVIEYIVYCRGRPSGVFISSTSYVYYELVLLFIYYY